MLSLDTLYILRLKDLIEELEDLPEDEARDDLLAELKEELEIMRSV